MKLKAALDHLYKTFDFEERAAHDPISIPRRYKRKEDIEVAGFIASAFAYGRVDLFLPVLGRLMGVMGRSPAGYAMDFDIKRESPRLRDVTYRFYQTGDVARLMCALRDTLRADGSLEAAFMAGYSEADADIGPALGAFMARISGMIGKADHTPGFRHFFPSPRTGAAKRGCLYLRWMVRSADIDFGLWRGVPARKLVIPLDTHIMRVSRCLGLTKLRSAGFGAASEITASLRVLDPADPLKYDFALCHRGIAGLCGPKECPGCALREASLAAPRPR